MSSATIFVTATHKIKENYGYFAVSMLKKRAKQPVDVTGQFESESKVKTQLYAMIQGLTLAKTIPDLEELTIVTDFSQVSKITDGTLDIWAESNWMKTKNKPFPFAQQWKDIFDLINTLDVFFKEPDESDEKMKHTLSLMKLEQKKPRNPILMEKGEFDLMQEGQELQEGQDGQEGQQGQEGQEGTFPQGNEQADTNSDHEPLENQYTMFSERLISAGIVPGNKSPEKESKVILLSTGNQENVNLDTDEKVPFTYEGTEGTFEDDSEGETPSLKVAEQRMKSATVSRDKIQQGVFDFNTAMIKVDSSLKKDSEELFAQLGMDVDVAVTLFLKHSLRKKGFTLDLTLGD